MQRSDSVMSRQQVAEELRRLGLQPTGQRLAIAEILLRSPTHLTADQILTAVTGSGDKISKATVYNTLKLLTQHGLIRRINIDPQRCVYDSTRTPHHHFHDVETGELFDIPPQDIAFSRLPPLPEGMEADAVEVIIRLRKKR